MDFTIIYFCFHLLLFQSRPPGIYKQDYLDELFRRYGDPEDTPSAPPLPQWCTGMAVAVDYHDEAGTPVYSCDLGIFCTPKLTEYEN